MRDYGDGFRTARRTWQVALYVNPSRILFPGETKGYLWNTNWHVKTTKGNCNYLQIGDIEAKPKRSLRRIITRLAEATWVEEIYFFADINRLWWDQSLHCYVKYVNAKISMLSSVPGRKCSRKKSYRLISYYYAFCANKQVKQEKIIASSHKPNYWFVYSTQQLLPRLFRTYNASLYCKKVT